MMHSLISRKETNHKPQYGIWPLPVFHPFTLVMILLQDKIYSKSKMMASFLSVIWQVLSCHTYVRICTLMERLGRSTLSIMSVWLLLRLFQWVVYYSIIYVTFKLSDNFWHYHPLPILTHSSEVCQIEADISPISYHCKQQAVSLKRLILVVYLWIWRAVF